MTDRPLALLALFFLAGAATRATADDAPAAQPNVVMIWADDLTAGALGCYGLPDSHTPNIDRLAARSVVFDRAYCAYPVCGPTRLACMAGLDCESLGVLKNYESAETTDRALEGRPSLSQAFRRAGYRPMRSGKIYHQRIPGDITAGVAGPDHAASWDETYNAHADEWATPGEHEQIGGADSKIKLKIDRSVHYRGGFGGAFYVVEADAPLSEMADVKVADNAIAMLDRHIETHGEQPFFLGVGFIRPHVPFVAPRDQFELYTTEEAGFVAVPSGDRDDIPSRLMGRRAENYGLTTEARQRRARQAYYVVTAFMDQQVGRVLDALEERGLSENTIIVFQSDHGWHLGEHGFWQKASLHEESVRIPLMIAAPGMQPSRTDALVSQLDLYPTLCELADVQPPKALHGESLNPLLQGETDRVHDAVSSVTNFGRLLRTDRYAYIRTHDGTQRIVYDMQTDPQQHDNIAASQPELVSQLDEAWTAHRATLGLADIQTKPNGNAKPSKRKGK